jgi:hypothetical protein
MAEQQTTVTCIVCSKPVSLEECLFNEVGHPLHENCLAGWIRVKEEVKKPAKQQSESVK